MKHFSDVDAGYVYVHHRIHGFIGILQAPAGKTEPRMILLTEVPDGSYVLLGCHVEYVPAHWARMKKVQLCP